MRTQRLSGSRSSPCVAAVEQVANRLERWRRECRCGSRRRRSPSSMLNVVDDHDFGRRRDVGELRCASRSARTRMSAGTRSSTTSRIRRTRRCSMRWMMRCSVGVKSRPSTRVWKRPSPPNRLSTTRNTSVGSKTNSALPRSGLTCTRLRLVGTTRLRTNSLYLMRPHRAHRDLRAAAHEVEEADAQQAREALVDDLERRHAPAHDALLRGEVVRPDRAGGLAARRSCSSRRR